MMHGYIMTLHVLELKMVQCIAEKDAVQPDISICTKNRLEEGPMNILYSTAKGDSYQSQG